MASATRFVAVSTGRGTWNVAEIERSTGQVLCHVLAEDVDCLGSAEDWAKEFTAQAEEGIEE